jgi:hypothetical protein
MADPADSSQLPLIPARMPGTQAHYWYGWAN